MAAVRGGSRTGMIVALVIFGLVALGGIVGCVLIYQQLKIAKQQIADDRDAFREHVASEFTAAQWDLADQQPSPEAYQDVASKLAVAASYQNEVLPMLGWESLEGIETAMAESPVQEQEEAEYQTVQGLLSRYEDAYTSLNGQVADLQTRNASLSERLQSTRDQLAQTEQQLQQKLNAASEQFQKDVDALTSDYEQMVEEQEKQSRQAAEWRGKYQDIASQMKREVADLQENVRKWRHMYEQEVAGAGPRQKLAEQGHVLRVQPEFDFLMVTGGQDSGLEEADKLVIYSVNPDDTYKRKALVLVGEVHEHTSLATVAKEDEYVVNGDLYVKLERWNQFHGKAAVAEAPGGGE